MKFLLYKVTIIIEVCAETEINQIEKLICVYINSSQKIGRAHV